MITAEATQALSRVSLDFGEFRINRVLVDGKPAKYLKRGAKLHVRPAKPIAPGAAFTVEVHYVGNPRPVRSRWGDVGWDELTDGALVASQPVGAPSWFPCNDHPADKAAYWVAVTTASPYLVAVTGTLVERSTSASTTRWVFERPEPTSTYLMSVQIGRYDDVELSGRGWFPHAGVGLRRLSLGIGRASGQVESVFETVPQRAAVPSRLRRAFERDFGRQDRMMEFLQRLFGPYPFAEYVIVVTDDDLDDPIEAQGMSIFGANHVDGRRTLRAARRARAGPPVVRQQPDGRRLAAHLAQRGFRDLRRVAVVGGVRRPVGAGAGPRLAHRIKARPADVRIADPGVSRMFDERVYKRGALTLHALRAEIGDAAFFALLKAWTGDHRHGLVTTAEFVALAEVYAARPLTAFFARWLDTPALPPLPGP